MDDAEILAITKDAGGLCPECGEEMTESVFDKGGHTYSGYTCPVCQYWIGELVESA